MKFKINVFACAVLMLSVFNAIGQAPTSISGIINDYAAVTAIAQSSVLTVDSISTFQPCDKVLVIQMKGALIDTTNTSAYGTVISYNNAGNYEFSYISSISGNVVTLSAPLTRPYTSSGLIQLIKVPVYADVNVSGPLTCMAWNGSKGGILALEACHVTMNANIDVSGKGFLGGSLYNGYYSSTGHTDYVLTYPSAYTANKGEGIFVTHITSQAGRGNNANGGGGGNDINGGGAGGSNCGAGGTGGNVNSSASSPPWTPIAAGGVGGNALPYGIMNKLFLGGGGGAGHENDNVGTAGGNGGGIIIIQATKITGNSQQINAKGDSVAVSGIDGQGGGGAGGVIVLQYPSATDVNNVTLSVEGGNGGHDTFQGPDCHGKGGGGGGGVIWTNFTLPTTNIINVNGGLAGVYTNTSSACYNTSFGASNGQNGCVLTDLNLITGATTCSRISCGILTVNVSLKTTNPDIVIFPNPSNGSLTIKGLVDGVKTTLRVTNILGIVIFDIDITSIDGTYKLDLPAGETIYFMELKNNNTALYKKITISK